MRIENRYILVILFISSTFATGEVDVSNENKKPKSLINLGVMAATHIPCDFPYFPIPYGCWCGITLPWPSPYKPIDDLDEACKTHDWCYEDAVDSGCSILDEYIFNYKWHDDNGEIICDDTNEPCQMKICQCDKSVIETLSSEVEVLGCPEADPGCSQVPDNSTFLTEIE